MGKFIARFIKALLANWWPVMPTLIGQWQITVVNSALIGEFVVTNLKKLSSAIYAILLSELLIDIALTGKLGFQSCRLCSYRLLGCHLSDRLNRSDFPFVVGTGARSNSSLLVHVVKILTPPGLASWFSKF